MFNYEKGWNAAIEDFSRMTPTEQHNTYKVVSSAQEKFPTNNRNAIGYREAIIALYFRENVQKMRIR